MIYCSGNPKLVCASSLSRNMHIQCNCFSGLILSHCFFAARVPIAVSLFGFAIKV